jgi:hypothetical protein
MASRSALWRSERLRRRAARERGGYLAVTLDDVLAADALSRCLEYLDDADATSGVIRELTPEIAGEVTPLLDVARLLRAHRYTLLAALA